MDACHSMSGWAQILFPADMHNVAGSSPGIAYPPAGTGAAGIMPPALKPICCGCGPIIPPPYTGVYAAGSGNARAAAAPPYPAGPLKPASAPR
eukprot:1159049-Pelagomonas_calceolata.AAC.3